MTDKMRHWSDFARQRIDPFEFAEEMPKHFADVEAFIAEDARCVDGQCSAAAMNTDCFNEYVEYFDAARVDPRIMVPLNDAMDAVERALASMRGLANALAEASEAFGVVKRIAVEVYDYDIPRYDKANG